MSIPSNPTAAPPPNTLTTVGPGYAIAIALAFLVLLSTILLASYLCCRLTRHRRNPNNSNSSDSATSSDNGIILPRIIFVAEDDEENDAQNAVVGLDPVVINSYPKFKFSKGAGNDSVCAICLSEYKDAEMMRMLPDCRHYFHSFCVDAWLRLNASCPVCRNSPLPTPLSTPLAEVVPLSQYSDGRNRRR